VTTLHTIAFSHYCERARWALQRAEIPFDERGYLPMFHMPAIAIASGMRPGAADANSSALSTPLLRLDDGGRLHDSAAIVAYAAQHGGARAVPLSGGDAAVTEVELARQLGPDARLLAYHYLLDDHALLSAVVRHNVGAGQRAAWTLGRPALVGAMRKALGIRPSRAARAQSRIEALWDRLDAQFADGRAWIGGDRFGSADLTLAALAAPILGIDAAAGYGAWLPPLAALPAAMRADVLRWRARPTGQRVVRAYAEERR
jgi:glutathione S-transferase